MQEIFLSKTIKSTSITIEAIQHLIEMELNKIIFPDGVMQTIRFESQKILLSFLDHIYSPAAVASPFLSDFDHLLMENRNHHYQTAIIAWIWLGVVRKLAGLEIIPDPSLNELYSQMVTIASNYGRML